jgi:hypothetical protein
MSAQVIGIDDYKRGADRVAKAIVDRTRAVASRTAARVADGIRSRVRYKTGVHLRHNVVIQEDAAGRRFLVGFRDITADDATGRNPMIPVWHEFGTRKLAANPAVGNSYEAERPHYEAEMRQVIDGALREMA